MKKIDAIYDAVDDYGLITAEEAKDAGVSHAEMVQFANRDGKLLRLARGLYKMPVWPYQHGGPYAIAVKSVGKDAYLYGESVLGLLRLIPINPTRIWVATPRRVRRSTVDGIEIIDRMQEETTTVYDGVITQRVEQAIISAVQSVGIDRAKQAAIEAGRQGYLTTRQVQTLEKEISNGEKT